MDRPVFIDRLKSRLASEQAPFANHLRPPMAPPDAGDDRGRMDLFLTRLGELGVRVRVATLSEARAEVERLMDEREWASVACSSEVGWAGIADRRTAEPRWAPLGLDHAALAVAETGSVLVGSQERSKRGYSLLPPTVGFFVPRDLIVGSLSEALRWISSLPDVPACLTFVTGPSTTADIASTHVVGAQGPGEVLVWIISNGGDRNRRPTTER
jgi:hypothetical protein